jgi:hypothetical protein
MTTHSKSPPSPSATHLLTPTPTPTRVINLNVTGYSLDKNNVQNSSSFDGVGPGNFISTGKAFNRLKEYVRPPSFKSAGRSG